MLGLLLNVVERLHLRLRSERLVALFVHIDLLLRFSVAFISILVVVVLTFARLLLLVRL